MFSIKNDVDLLQECGFLEKDDTSLHKEFKNMLTDQNEEYLSYIKNEEELLIEIFLKK